MNAASKDVKDMLEAYGDSSAFPFVLGISIFYGKEPTLPKYVTILDSIGRGPDLGLTTKGYERPNIQIRIKDANYDNAMKLANEIKDALHGRAQEVWNGTLYSVIICTGGPALLDWDDSGKCRIIINFNLQRRVA